MPIVRWTSISPAVLAKSYLALLSYLPLRHFRALPKFFRYSAQTQRQLKTTPGIIGYALQARPLSLQFWTLSVWEDQQSLNNFVKQAPHGEIMRALAPHMGETRFAQWTVAPSEIPPDWPSALARLNQS